MKLSLIAVILLALCMPKIGNADGRGSGNGRSSRDGNQGSGGGTNGEINESMIKNLLIDGSLKSAMLNYVKSMRIDKVENPGVRSTLARITAQSLQDDIRDSIYEPLPNCRDNYDHSKPASAFIGKRGTRICFDVSKLADEYKGLSSEVGMIKLASLAFHEHIHHFQRLGDRRNETEAFDVAGYIQLTAKVVQIPLLKWEPNATATNMARVTIQVKGHGTDVATTYADFTRQAKANCTSLGYNNYYQTEGQFSNWYVAHVEPPYFAPSAFEGTIECESLPTTEAPDGEYIRSGNLIYWCAGPAPHDPSSYGQNLDCMIIDKEGEWMRKDRYKGVCDTPSYQGFCANTCFDKKKLIEVKKYAVSLPNVSSKFDPMDEFKCSDSGGILTFKADYLTRDYTDSTARHIVFHSITIEVDGQGNVDPNRTSAWHEWERTIGPQE